MKAWQCDCVINGLGVTHETGTFCGRCGKYAPGCAPSPSPHDQPEYLLRNLLAVIHRDGGHYAAEHGLTKATEDAIELRNKMLSAHEQAVSLLGEAEQSLAKIETEMIMRGWSDLSYPVIVARPMISKLRAFLNSEKGQG